MTKSNQGSFKVAIILLLIGASISGLLVMQHYNQVHEIKLVSMMCGDDATSGCNAVNRSEYSSLFGLPVASIGLWFYLAMAVLLFLVSFGGASANDAAGWICFLGICAALIVDLALLAVQLFTLKTFCNLCITTYVINGLLFALLYAYRRKGSGEKVKELIKGSEGKMLFGSWAVSAVLLVAVVGAGSLALAYRDPAKLEERFDTAALEEFLQSPVQEINLAGVPMQGAADAPIKIVIFSDFLCPWCRQVAQSFQQNMPQWKDRVAIYYKSYPLDKFCNPYQQTAHPGACWAALGGVCADAQGKFWEYHDRIFTTPPTNPTSAVVLKIAAEAGLDTSAMATCMHEGQMQNKVRAQITDAHNSGINGTPRIFINGRKLPKVSYLPAILAIEAKRLGIKPLEGLKD